MKSYFCIALFCICVSGIIASTPLFCAEQYTQHYNLGQGCLSKCREKCPTYPPRICTDECVEGCMCQWGWNRAENGTCIKTEACPVNCPRYSSYKCGCNDTCTDYRIQCVRCQYDCFCNDGFKRLNGVCVPQNKCK